MSRKKKIIEQQEIIECLRYSVVMHINTITSLTLENNNLKATIAHLQESLKAKSALIQEFMNKKEPVKTKHKYKVGQKVGKLVIVEINKKKHWGFYSTYCC